MGESPYELEVAEMDDRSLIAEIHDLSLHGLDEVARTGDSQEFDRRVGIAYREAERRHLEQSPDIRWARAKMVERFIEAMEEMLAEAEAAGDDLVAELEVDLMETRELREQFNITDEAQVAWWQITAQLERTE